MYLPSGWTKSESLGHLISVPSMFTPSSASLYASDSNSFGGPFELGQRSMMPLSFIVIFSF